MANPVLESVAEDLKTITANLEQAEDLVSVMKEAGEPTQKLEQDIRQLKIRKEKWERVLNSRGISTKQK